MGKLNPRIEKATSENNTSENWQEFMNIADELKSASFEECKDAVQFIMKRLKNIKPLVISYTLSLLHACVENAGLNFRKAVCSRDTMVSLKHVVKSRIPEKLKKQLRDMLVQWSKDFGTSSELRLFSATVDDWRQEGLITGNSTSIPATTPTSKSNFLASSAATQSTASNSQYEADLARAIAESLSDETSSRQNTKSQRFNSAPPTPRQRRTGEPAKVLYDFEGSEENELSLAAGDVIKVIDKSDNNWWQGVTKNGEEGFFPSSFVTFDLNAQAINEQEANEPTEEQEQEEQHTEAQPLSEAHHVKTNALFTVDSLAFVAILLDSHSFIIRISANMCFVTYGRASARYAYTLIDATVVKDNIAAADKSAAFVTIDRAKFDRFAALVLQTQPGNRSNDNEIERLERNCEVAMNVVSERIDDYDRRLARMNQVLEKHALIQDLCSRLMQQQPGMARVFQQPSYPGVSMSLPQQQQYAAPIATAPSYSPMMHTGYSAAFHQHQQPHTTTVPTTPQPDYRSFPISADPRAGQLLVTDPTDGARMSTSNHYTNSGSAVAHPQQQQGYVSFSQPSSTTLTTQPLHQASLPYQQVNKSQHHTQCITAITKTDPEHYSHSVPSPQPQQSQVQIPLTAQPQQQYRGPSNIQPSLQQTQYGNIPKWQGQPHPIQPQNPVGQELASASVPVQRNGPYGR
eukprot:gene666-7883_t